MKGPAFIGTPGWSNATRCTSLRTGFMPIRSSRRMGNGRFLSKSHSRIPATMRCRRLVEVTLMDPAGKEVASGHSEALSLSSLDVKVAKLRDVSPFAAALDARKADAV